MADVEYRSGFTGLADFIVGLIDETIEAVHRTQIEQSSHESELKAVASLEIEAAAEKLVTIEAAQATKDQLLIESGAKSSWTERHSDFLRLAEQRFGLELKSGADYDRLGLTRVGEAKVIDAARKSIAVEQVELVRRLLMDGTRRVKIASGAISVKLELRAHRTQAAPTSSAGGGKKQVEPNRP